MGFPLRASEVLTPAEAGRAWLRMTRTFSFTPTSKRTFRACRTATGLQSSSAMPSLTSHTTA